MIPENQSMCLRSDKHWYCRCVKKKIQRRELGKKSLLIEKLLHMSNRQGIQ